MRAKLDEECAAVAEEVASGALQWNRRSVQRLMTPYPARREYDDILRRLGEDFGQDAISQENYDNEGEGEGQV